MRERSRSIAVSVGVLGSGLLHAALYALLNWRAALPALDFELQLPSPMEFGLVEQESTGGEPPASAPATEVAREEQHAAAPGESIAKAVQERAPPSEAAPDREERASPPLLSSFAPVGAQIALRVDMRQVRNSALADDVRAFLEAVPDWRLILEGSELDPVHDLERLYLASPDLRRSKLVIAGQYRGNEQVPRQAVARMAVARGVEPHWRKLGRVAVAHWANQDTTERVLALIAPHQFVITRASDLSRVLQVARALARKRAQAANSTAVARSIETADALLGLNDGETLALTVDRPSRFIRGNQQGMPEDLEVAVYQRDGGRIEVRLRGQFKDGPSAIQARLYWERLRDRFASHPLVAFIGMRSPLAEAHFSVEPPQLQVNTWLTSHQARVVLEFLRGAIAPTAPNMALPPAPDLLRPRTDPRSTPPKTDEPRLRH